MSAVDRRFVEQMGLLYQELGAPRMMGRIIGWLMICEPPHQSEAQLCAALSASKGAVNTSSRQLVHTGLLERVAVHGERATFLRLRDDAWTNNFRQGFGVVHKMQQLARDGLAAMADAPPAHRERLHRFHRFYEFIEREVEPMIDRYAASGHASDPEGEP